MGVFGTAVLLALAAVTTALWPPEDSLRRALDVVSHRRRLADPRHLQDLLLRELDRRLDDDSLEQPEYQQLPPSFHQKPRYPSSEVRKRQSSLKPQRSFSKRYVDDWTNPYGYLDLSRKRRAIIKRSEGNKKLMSELGEILKDDAKGGAKVTLKKRQNDEFYDGKAAAGRGNYTEIKTEAKRFAESPRPEDEAQEIGADAETPGDNDDNDKKKVPEWLKDEYYRTMAATFSTLRRKRRGFPSPEPYPSSPASSLGGRFSQVMNKLNSIEEAMVTDALDMIQQGSSRDRILTKLSAAYDVDKIRESLEHLEQTMDRMEDSADTSFPLEEKRESRNMAEALSVMATKRSKGEEPFESELSNEIPMAPDLSEFDTSSELDFSDKTSSDECPALDLLTSDCAVLGDVVPGGRVRDVVLRACNWHELCYSCGEAYGLTRSDCDVGFVAQSKAICRDEERCHSAARLMLGPLRQRRVFFKRSVPAVCYRQPCVGVALRQPLEA